VNSLNRRQLSELADKCRDIVESREAFITLDGKPAVLRGWKLEYGLIQCDNSSVEFSWPTIYRVLTERNGKFKS
jgi:hypothetical protein